MDVVEALTLAKQGKKIRKKDWPKNCYYEYKNGKFKNNEDISITGVGLSGEWEIYDPRIRFADLKIGDKFKMDCGRIFQKVKFYGYSHNYEYPYIAINLNDYTIHHISCESLYEKVD